MKIDNLKNMFRSPQALLIMAAIFSLILAGVVWPPRLRSSSAIAPSSSAPIRTDKPDREITADHQFKRVRHKDADGLAPLEFVQTPGGLVTIQRTFTSAGTLLKEEAFLDGKQVPVPKQ